MKVIVTDVQPPALLHSRSVWLVCECGNSAHRRLVAHIYLLHCGFVQLIEIQRIDAILGPKYQVLI